MSALTAPRLHGGIDYGYREAYPLLTPWPSVAVIQGAHPVQEALRGRCNGAVGTLDRTPSGAVGAGPLDYLWHRIEESYQCSQRVYNAAQLAYLRGIPKL